MKAIGFIAGATLGAMAVYHFVLNPIEQAAFQIFRWGIQNNTQVFDGDTIANSSTFWKMAGGAIVGGLIGSAVGGSMAKAKSDKD